MDSWVLNNQGSEFWVRASATSSLKICMMVFIGGLGGQLLSVCRKSSQETPARDAASRSSGIYFSCSFGSLRSR